MDLSVILPVYNEKKNLPILYTQLKEVLETLNCSYEIIMVDDGSKDGSDEILKDLALKDPALKAIFFRRNFGQTPATAAGIDHSLGKIIVIMDSDLQNDPKDIPKLLEKINQGYDLVSGWRKNRKDKFFSRKIPSWLANRIIKKVSGVEVKDLGCSLKAYKREVLKNVKLYGEMHRFLPIYASWIGAKIDNIEVAHHPRKFGKSKYGISRTFRVLIDLLTIKFMGGYATKPMHFFGKLTFLNFFLSLAFLGVYVYRVISTKQFLKEGSLLLVFLFWGLGMLFLGFGLVAEIMVRTYYESQNKPIYFIKKTLNLPNKEKKEN